MDTTYPEPQLTFSPDFDYPVALAIYHFNTHGEEFAVSGDKKHRDYWENKKFNHEERQQFPITWL